MKKCFLVMAVGIFFLAACGLNKTKDQSAEATEVEATASTDEVIVQGELAVLSGVQGSCEQCKERIEKAAKEVPGVFSATWDSEKKELQLDLDPSQTNLDAISKAVAATGHDTEKDKAAAEIYNALPDCCKYR
jgi:Cu(I)/Ag(I) efflux system membrane fusion protein